MCKVVNAIGKKRQAKTAGVLSPVKAQPTNKATRDIVAKIDKLTKKKNPPGQRYIAKLCHVSQLNVGHIILEDLRKVTKKKNKVHALSESYEVNRTTNCKEFCECHLAGDKCKYSVTLKEAWYLLQDSKGTTNISYRETGAQPPDFVVQKRESLILNS